MKFKLGILTLLLMCGSAFAQVGSRFQPVSVHTNTGTVSFGTNAYSVVNFTNTIAFSNIFSIGSGGVFTNNAPSVLSNLVTHGTATFNSNLQTSLSGTTIFNNPIIISNSLSRVASNTALTSITNNDFSVSNTIFIAITNTTQTNIVFTGFSGGRDGQPLTIINQTLTNVFFIDQSASSTPGNKILLLNGQTTLTNLGNGCTEFIYSTTGTNWFLKSFIP